MNSEQLESWLERRLPQYTVRHVVNWGGFVNWSFTIDQGNGPYHLKITDDFDNIAKLRAWYAIHALLEARYRAPQVIEWMDFHEIGFAGLLQRHIAGHTANLHNDPALLRELIGLVGRLHQDEDIRSRYNVPGSQKTCFDHFVATYIDRFTADLELVAGDQPEFIPPALLEWMRQETIRLKELAALEPAFQSPADHPVHGDLHEGNVLVTSAEWFVVDWDDLTLGDPALDFAVLLWPMIYRGADWRDLIPHTSEDFARRIELCLRAQLLDEVIDPLADYVAADLVPSRKVEVQDFKRTRHEEALGMYRKAFNSWNF